MHSKKLCLLFVLAAGAARPAIAAPATVFRLDGVDGRSEMINAAALGRPVLVGLLSLREPGWEEELRDLRGLHRRYGSGLAVVAAAAPFKGAGQRLAAFAIAEKISFPLGIDHGGGPFNIFSADIVPRTVLLGAAGTVILASTSPVAALGDILPALVSAEIRASKKLIKERHRLARERAKTEKTLVHAARKVKAVPPEELKARLDAGGKPFIVFIGSGEFFAQKHIPGAQVVDFNQAEAFFASQDKAKEWLLYCACASDELGLSGRVAARLYLDGFKRVGYLKGHFQEWERLGYPLDTVKE